MDHGSMVGGFCQEGVFTNLFISLSRTHVGAYLNDV